jgi:anaerobic magnesium-protoporphyrin IX monomethyl ester cyclase
MQQKKCRPKALLINPFTHHRNISRMFPTALGIVARLLVDSGAEVNVLDISGEGMSWEDVEKRLNKLDFDVVCLTSLVTQYRNIRDLCARIKKFNPSARIIVGGGLARFAPKELLENTDCDIACTGDELIVLDIVNNLGSLSKVRGIFYKVGGRIVRTSSCSLNEQLSEIPMPAYHLFPIQNYLNKHKFFMVKRSINLVASRGCSYNCAFCCHAPDSQVQRGVKSVISEIRYLMKAYGIRSFIFSDECFTYNKDWVLEFCRKIKNYKIRYAIYTRSDLVDDEIMESLKGSGCSSIFFGFESMDQKILDTHNKGLSVKDNEKAVQLSRKYRLPIFASFIFGSPGETRDTIRKTVEFSKEYMFRPYFWFCTPFPGSRIYESCLKDKLIVDKLRYFEKLGDMRDTFVLNLTSMSDEELVNLHKETLDEIDRWWRKQNTLPMRLLNDYYAGGLNLILDYLKDKIKRNFLGKIRWSTLR